jgi:hypothetical protein
MRRHMLIGGVCGLAWAAALRGWMVQLVGAESTFSWLTVVLVLAPGVAVGALLGRAARRRTPSRWLIFAPALFASALLDPEIFVGLFRDGTGGGALIVVATALTGGYVLAHRGFSVARTACAVVAVLGVLLLTFIGSMAAPMTSPRGAWNSLFGLSLILLLCLASALAYPARTRVPLPVIGALCGLAWACALRSFMTAVAGPASEIHWVNTFGFILLPGVLAGALLGWAAQTSWPRRRLLALSPLLYVAVLLSDPLDIGALLDDGVGGGAIGVPVIGILGGYAVSGRGARWRRIAAGAVFVAGLAVWAVTAPAVGGPDLALTTPHGMWATLLYWALLTTLALAASVPLRDRVRNTTAAPKNNDPIGPIGGSESRIGMASGAPS